MFPTNPVYAGGGPEPTTALPAAPSLAGSAPSLAGSAPPPSPAPTPPGRGRWRGRRLIVAGTAAVLVTGAGATAAYATHGDVPRGTTVFGVDLGGNSRAEARAALQQHLDGRAAELAAPVKVRIGDKDGTVKPADVGLRVDVDATVEAAARGGVRLFGSRTVEPVTSIDATKLDAALRKAFGKLGAPMRKPAITFAGTTPKATYPEPGQDLDVTASADAVRAGWLGGQPITVPTVQVHPASTKEDVDKLLTTLARPAVASPVTITSDRGTLTVPPEAVARSLVLTADDSGAIKPRLDHAKLRTALASPLARLETTARDARMTISGGKPAITAGAEGSALDLAALAPQLLTVLGQSDGRTVAATVRTVPPKMTAEKLGQLGIKEKVSTFTTKFPGGLSSPRSQNIVQIAKQVDGAVVQPGATFSLNGHTGERTYAKGYKDAPVILDGKLTPGVGGGASQFTTTLFNATYYAGLEDVEHKPHSYYFNRYPSVIESTIFYPDLDFRFKNDSPHGVLLDTSYTSSTITVSVWSTKVWEKVTTERSARRNVTSPQTITLPAGPDCIATDGINGFTQDAWRLFHQDGKVVKREKFTWKYLAEPRYICGGED
ncbi:VanW family protein [Paractinoplanes rishiriensis]|uniref:VanW family protein n=1 Tax=Paractinoplanes rishiriensis TaxID=1050105 RepID=UPI003F68DFA3